MCEDLKFYENFFSQHEVNKRIMAKEGPRRGEHDILNITGRYRDEDYALYERKRNQFYESVKQYKDFNKRALVTNNVKSDISTDEKMRYDFLIPTQDFLKDEYIPGSCLRKRTLRRAYGSLENPLSSLRTSEPWYRRYLVLGKFIKAARDIVVRNRMLKRLDILKTLDLKKIEQYEAQGFLVINQVYPEIFDKFK